MSFAQKYTLICVMSEKKQKLERGGGQVKNTMENLKVMGLGTQGGIKTLGDRKVRRG